MKKRILILLIAIAILPLKAFAAGGFSVSTGSVTMYPGDSKSITIGTNNAVGKLNISTGNSGVASVSTGSIFIQNPGASGSFTITANAVGSTTVTVVASSNFATMDEEILEGQAKYITVNVVSRPSNNNTNTNTNTNTRTNTSTTSSGTAKSTNNSLKEISVEGYNLEKVDDNNYKLKVNNSVTSVNVKASASDSKATVTGTGAHEIKVGDNTIEVVITSESGSQNKINIVVTRKDAYYLEDLTESLKENKTTTNIKVTADTTLTKEQLEQIKKSGKVVSFNYYDENNILKYSWTIDGSKINNIKELQLDIDTKTDNSKKILKLSNYASGIYLNFKYSGDLPKGTKIKYFVGDEYNDNEKMNLYYYNSKTNKLEVVEKNLVVKDGYVEFEIEHCSDYFLSMTEVTNAVEKKSINWFMIISIIEFILIVAALTYYFIKIKFKRKF